jgi:ribosomal protein S18 acetylase RimI-like enzyme
MYSFTRVNANNCHDLNRIRNSVREFLHDSRIFNLDETVSWISENRSESYYYVVFDSQIIGYLRLSKNKTYFDQSIMVGLDLDVNWQGNGHGKRIWAVVIRKLGKDLNYIELKVLQGNFRAILLYLSLGFMELESGRSDRDIHFYFELHA